MLPENTTESLSTTQLDQIQRTVQNNSRTLASILTLLKVIQLAVGTPEGGLSPDDQAALGQVLSESKNLLSQANAVAAEANAPQNNPPTQP